MIAPAGAGAAPAPAKLGFVASSYGTYAAAGTLLKSAPTAASALTCSAPANTTRTNSTASVNAAPAISGGAVNTEASSASTAAGSSSHASAVTGSISLLGGIITAGAVDAESTTSYANSGAKFSTSGEGSSFANLVVAGKPIAGTPAPNTRITLPGIGYVILNRQVGAGINPGAGLTVQGIYVAVTAADAVLPSGARVVVSSATSGLSGPQTTLLSGTAYGSYAKVGSVVTSNATFPVGLPCGAATGATKTNSGAGISLPGVVSTGTITNTATGSATASAHMTSSVQNLNLLLGTVSVGAIDADISATGSPSTLTDNSTFASLQVRGFPAINAAVAPNTSVNVLPGVTLYLHKRVKTAHLLTVIMVQLQVTGANLLGLQTGTTINIGVASITA